MRAGERLTCADCGGTIRRFEPVALLAGRWTHPTPADCGHRPVDVSAPVRPYLSTGGAA